MHKERILTLVTSVDSILIMLARLLYYLYAAYYFFTVPSTLF
jgi:hypothetical protein